VRRQFNLLWKAPGQRPRGDFREVVSPLGEGWRRLDEGRVPMRLALGAREVQGLILSQSRYLHYERALPDPAVERSRVARELERHLVGESPEWDFALKRALFRKAT
jgi:hypothetical protein